MHHIPNIISSIRILLIPVIVTLYTAGNHVGAAIVLAISGLTDMLDGSLARKFGWTSQLGKVLDPAADKLTLLSVCVLLLVKLDGYRAFFIILLVKDFIMLVLGGSLLKDGVTIHGAKWFGKVATVVFYVGMVALWLFDMPQWAIVTILTIITVLEVTSALLYIPDYMEYRKQRQ